MAAVCRGRRALVGVLVLALGPGCHLARWGRGQSDPDYSPLREAWEVPLGWAAMPLAVTVDATLSLTLTLLVGAGNPINWLLMALDQPPILGLAFLLPCTSTALTLANDRCNLDWSRPAPEGVAGLAWDDDDDDPESDPESQREEWEMEVQQAEHQRVEERLR